MRRRSALGLGAFLLVLGLLTFAAMRVDALLGRELAGVMREGELIYLPSTPFLKGVSLGYEHVLADIVWFRTISYFGRHYLSDRLYPWLAGMCDAVTDLDPRAEHVYRFGGLILPWEADMVDAGIRLLRRGVYHLPESWELKYILGFTYYFFKDDVSSAVAFLRAAAVLPGAPPDIGRLAIFVEAAHAGPSGALDFLASLERGGMSAEMSTMIRQRILELTLARDIDQLEAAAQTFRERVGRAPMGLDDIVRAGLVPAIPQEPFGGRYVLDSETGRVRSDTGHTPWRLPQSPMRKATLERQRSGGE